MIAAMFRTALVLSAVTALLLAPTAQAGKSRPNLRIVEVNGSVSVEGTPSAQSPVRFASRLIADTAGVPLQRGGRAYIKDGRLEVNTMGTVVSSCLSPSSLRLSATGSTGTRESAKARGDVLRIAGGKRLALDLGVSVDTALRGFVGPVCGPGSEAVQLQLRGKLPSGALAPVQVTGSTPVTLQNGSRVTMKVKATVTVRRYRTQS